MEESSTHRRSFPSINLLLTKIRPLDCFFICFFLLGIMIRLSFIIPADFPIHDGGLFYIMMQDIGANHFALPWYTSYNFDKIAFAYPPLALYFGTVLNQIFHVDLFWILRFVPFLMNIATALAVYHLARTLKQSKETSSISFLAFLLLPEGFRWLIMGGGLTRSTGLLFAVLAISSIYRVYTHPNWQKTLIAAVFCSLVVLTHLEMAWFTFYSAILLFLFFGRSIKSAGHSIIIAGVTLTLTAPWWVTVISRFGTSIFIFSVSGSTEQWPVLQGFTNLLFNNTQETFFPVLGGLAILGVVLLISRGEFFLPTWAITVFLIQGRGSYAKAAIPFALLIGIAITEGIAWIIQQTGLPNSKQKNFFMSSVAILSILFVALSSTIGYRKLLSPLSTEERYAMKWVSENTASTDKFLIVTADWWGADRVSEWFPILSHRNSIATVQGYEFSLQDSFSNRIKFSNTLQKCTVTGDLSCIEDLLETEKKAPSYIYIPKSGTTMAINSILSEDCCTALRRAFQENENFQLVFENSDVVIYRNALKN